MAKECIWEEVFERTHPDGKNCMPIVDERDLLYGVDDIRVTDNGSGEEKEVFWDTSVRKGPGYYQEVVVRWRRGVSSPPGRRRRNSGLQQRYIEQPSRHAEFK